METLRELTLGQIVTRNYKAAAIFEMYGMDFCCMGNRNFVEACQASGINPDEVMAELNQLDSGSTEHVDFDKWPLDLLADYIYNRHHKYLEQTTPTLKSFLDKICLVHGEHHPELHEIRKIFYETSGELAAHMKKEELLIFPFIKKLIQAKADGSKPSSKVFETVANPVSQMQSEHLDEGIQLQRMAALSKNYTIPEDACTTFRITYQMLKEYEADMHMHIHLENNILFPKTIRLEQELVQNAE